MASLYLVLCCPSFCCVAALEVGRAHAGSVSGCRILVDQGYFWCTLLKAPVMTAPSFSDATSELLPFLMSGFLSLVLVTLLPVWICGLKVSSLTLPKLGLFTSGRGKLSHETCVTWSPTQPSSLFSNPRTIAFSVWLAPLISPWRIFVSVNLFLWVSSLRHRSYIIFFFPSSWFCVNLSFSTGYYRNLFAQYQLFSLRFLLVDVLVMCLWQGSDFYLDLFQFYIFCFARFTLTCLIKEFNWKLKVSV